MILWSMGGRFLCPNLTKEARMTIEMLREKLAELDEGLLRKGSHPPGREFCALEFVSQVEGREWSGQPVTMFDVRLLNDGFSNDGIRTREMLPLLAALWGSQAWSQTRQKAWTQIVVLRTVREIIAELPELSVEVRTQCRSVRTLEEASLATLWAVWTSARITEAKWAGEAAALVARTMPEGAGDMVLQRACCIGIEAAEETSNL